MLIRVHAPTLSEAMAGDADRVHALTLMLIRVHALSMGCGSTTSRYDHIVPWQTNPSDQSRPTLARWERGLQAQNIV